MEKFNNSIILATSDESKENDEIILFEEHEREEERIEQSESEVEIISDEEYMLECARYGDFEDLKKLFEENKTIDINYVDNRQNTALHMASANGHLDIVKLLVDEKNSNLNLKNYAGNTPLHWAAVNGQKEIVVYLVEKGADIFIKNNQGKVASEEAYEKQYFEISEIILDKEYELNKGKNTMGENIEMEIEIAKEIENEIKEDLDNIKLNDHI